MAASNYTSIVEQLYVSYLGRPADPTGLAYYANMLNAAGAPTTSAGFVAAYEAGSNVAVVNMINSFAASNEAKALYSATTVSDQINQIYQNVLGRPGEPAGLAFWTASVNSGAHNPAAIAFIILNAAQNNATTDTLTLANKVATAIAYTASIDTAAEIAAYSGNAAAAVGRGWLSAITATSGTGTPTQASIDANILQLTGGASVGGGITVRPTPAATMNLTVAGESVLLSGSTGTISLSGADLVSYPAARYGTVALANDATPGIAIINSVATATLSAAGNSAATGFNFATGVVSGTDAVNATLKYTGFTSYVASSHGDSITLSAANQNVTGGAGADTVAFAALATTGTYALGAGANHVTATIGGNLGGASITAAGGTADLTLSADGSETLSNAAYTLFRATGITFTGTAGASHDTIVFADAATATDVATVGNYTLGNFTNSFTVSNTPTATVTGGSAADTLILAAASFSGTSDLKAGANVLDVVRNGASSISAATLSATGGTLDLKLDGTATQNLSMTAAQYNSFNNIAVGTGTSAANSTITLTSAGTLTSNANIGNYALATGANTITLVGNSNNVTGAASGNNNVVIPQSGYTGTLAFGTSGTDIIQAPTNGDFSGLTLTSGGATLKLMITGVANGVPSGSTTSTEIYNLFTTGPNAGGIVFPSGGDTNPADYIITFKNQGTVTDSTSISNYNLNAAAQSTVNDIYTFNIANNSAAKISEHVAATGGSTFNITVASFTGSISLGSSGIDTIKVADGSNISGAQITTAGSSAKLSVDSGTVTVSSAQAALFHAATAAIPIGGSVTMNIADSTSAINLSAQENALANVGLQAGNTTVNISVGAASVSSGAAGFNQTLIENGAGNNTFTIDNGAATIVGATDASHYVTVRNFNTTSDTIKLTLSGSAQSAGTQAIADSGNDSITVANNGVILVQSLGSLPGFTVANATDVAAAKANLLLAVNASTATTGVYTFVVDTNQGAAIYETHINSVAGSVDGIQLVGVIQGVGAFNLTGHFS